MESIGSISFDGVASRRTVDRGGEPTWARARWWSALSTGYVRAAANSRARRDLREIAWRVVASAPGSSSSARRRFRLT